MTAEEKQCQNCKQNFVIEPEDFDFYEKIDVPAPTWCPECRMIRRLLFRNERVFYRGKCKHCNKEIISVHDFDSEYTIFCQECWKSDSWDPLEYYKEYNWKRNFFEQFNELRGQVPRPNVYQLDSKNSPYAHMTIRGKNLYLSFSVLESENVFFSRNIDFSSDIFDCMNLANSQNCYEVVFGEKNFNCRYIVQSRDCINSQFLFDCTNCHDCTMSWNLRNKEYVIGNKQHTKESYFEELEKMNLKTYSGVQVARKEFDEVVGRALHKSREAVRTVQSSGNYLRDVKNSKNIFEAYEVENAKNSLRIIKYKDVMDVCNSARSELVYEFVSGSNLYNLKFGMNCPDNIRSSEYIDYCQGIANCFGCVGLKNKQFCILNKQYEEKEYKELVSKIKRHMNEYPYVDSFGRIYKYGEFLPVDSSPFSYAESVANDYFKLDREWAINKGYKWKSPEKKDFRIDLYVNDLPDSTSEIREDILQKNIECEHKGDCTELCNGAFRITSDEFEFYKKNNIPLPRLCPNCRYFARKKYRASIHLWGRPCMCSHLETKYKNTTSHFHNKTACVNNIETPYAPDRPEIVYCEQCYNAEVV